MTIETAYDIIAELRDVQAVLDVQARREDSMLRRWDVNKAKTKIENIIFKLDEEMREEKE